MRRRRLYGRWLRFAVPWRDRANGFARRGLAGGFGFPVGANAEDVAIRDCCRLRRRPVFANGDSAMPAASAAATATAPAGAFALDVRRWVLRFWFAVFVDLIPALGLSLGTVHRNSGLQNLIGPSTASATAPTAAAMASLALVNLALSDDDRLWGLFGAFLRGDGLVLPFFLFRNRRDADRRARLRVLCRFFG